MRFTLTLDCDNAAFGETENDCAAEVGRILRNLDLYWGEGRIRDANGNAIGNWHFES